MRYPSHAVVAIATAALLTWGAVATSAAQDTSASVQVHYAQGNTEIATMQEGVKAFTNREYGLYRVPSALLGLTFTRRPVNVVAPVEVNAVVNSDVFVLLDSDSGPRKGAAQLIKQLINSGWMKIGDAQYIGSDHKLYPMAVFKRFFNAQEHLNLAGNGWSGCIVVARHLGLNSDSSIPTRTPKPAEPKEPKGTADKPEKDSSLHADPVPNTTPMSGPSTRPALPQTSIKSLEVYTQDSGMMLGQTSEVVLTLTRGTSPKLTTVQFVTSVGDQMRLARDEALRYIHLTYPNWNVDSAEISFEDKYVAHDGGSIGAAVGTMILSTIQGFQIDPDVAITGDISANGKVRAIGGVSAKLRGAVASKCSIVAIPTENVEQLADAVVYYGKGVVSDVQVLGISKLSDAVAVTRIDRDARLTEAIQLFATVQQAIKVNAATLKGKKVQDDLTRVLELAPNHLSAQILLSISEGKQPRTLSAGASRYYAFVAVNSILDVLKERSGSSQAQPPSLAVKAGMIDLRKLQPLANVNVRPLVEASLRFVEGWNNLQQGYGSAESVEKERQQLLDEMAKEQADVSMMQKMLKEGV